MVSMQLGADVRYSFAAPASAPLSVRVLVDTILVESFVGGGRGVASVPLKQAPPRASKASLWVAGTGARVKGSVWAMGCGWAL